VADAERLALIVLVRELERSPERDSVDSCDSDREPVEDRVGDDVSDSVGDFGCWVFVLENDAVAAVELDRDRCRPPLVNVSEVVSVWRDDSDSDPDF